MVSEGALQTAAATESSPLQELWALWLREQQFVQCRARALAFRSGSDADDLTDEALLRAVAATLRGAGPQREPRSWLKLLLDRTSVDQHRRRRRFADPESCDTLQAIADSWPTPEGELLSREEERSLAQSMARLPPAIRAPFELRVIDGCSYPAIAAQLGISQANARKRVQLARAWLRAERPACTEMSLTPRGADDDS